MVSHEQIAKCVGYLRTNEWRFSPMTDKVQNAITHSCLTGIATLQPNQKAGISHKVLGLLSDVEMITYDHPLRVVRHDQVVEDIVNVLETAGVIESARPGGLQRFKNRVMEEAYLDSGVSLSGLTVAYLGKQETDLRKARKSSRKRKTADLLLEITNGIKFELTRVGLVNPTKGEPKEIRPFESRPMVILQSELETSISYEGLIGFTPLVKIMQKFWDTRKYARIAGAWD